MNYDKSKYVLPSVERIVAIGDVHGDFDFLIELLKVARVIKENQTNPDEYDWIGGKTHVVQLGDQIDNCRPTNYICSVKGNVENDKANDAKIINFMDELDVKASDKKNGGRVISLLGNHEVMNILGEMSYVSYENLQEFGGEQERRKAFSPTGEYGKKLIETRPSAIIIGSNLFAHAGIMPGLLQVVPRLTQLISGDSQPSPKVSRQKMRRMRKHAMKPLDGGGYSIEEFIKLCVFGVINKDKLYSIGVNNPDFTRFWDAILIGRTRPYAELHINDVIESVNKLPTIKQIFIDNVDKINAILLEGGSPNYERTHPVEIINLAIKKWLNTGHINGDSARELSILNSLFWSRILGSLPKNQEVENDTCQKNFKPVLTMLNIRNMIIAHTPQFDASQTGINATCVTKKLQNGTNCMNDTDTSLWRIDIGGADAFDKFDFEYNKSGNVSQARRPQVLEILNDTCFNVLK
jgi:hypothetical protein